MDLEFEEKERYFGHFECSGYFLPGNRWGNVRSKFKHGSGWVLCVSLSTFSSVMYVRVCFVFLVLTSLMIQCIIYYSTI